MGVSGERVADCLAAGEKEKKRHFWLMKLLLPFDLPFDLPIVVEKHLVRVYHISSNVRMYTACT